MDRIERTGERLAAKMSERGVSKHQLALEAGVSYRTVCRIVSGDRLGYLDTWMRFAEALGCDVGELVDGAGGWRDRLSTRR